MSPAFRAQAKKLRSFRLIQAIGFNDCDSGCAIHSADNRGVVARREISHNRRFQVVRRRYASRDDLSFLIAPPIIIGSDECAVTVVQFQHWISQRARDWQRWTNRTHDDPER